MKPEVWRRAARSLRSGILVTGTVLMLVTVSPASQSAAQINDLGDTEIANVQLVLSNLDALIRESRAALPQNPTKQNDIDRVNEIEKLRQAYTNLLAKFNGHHIRSVPGLATGTPSKYREGGNESHPIAAYCNDETEVSNGNVWVRCPQGDIIIDSGVLDPTPGTPINENTMAGWEQKWRLLHILVHEKWHEIEINEQIAELKKREVYKRADAQKKRDLIKEVIRVGAIDAHRVVYTWQKKVVLLEKAVLDGNRKQLLDRINQINRELSGLNEQLGTLEGQLKAAETKLKTLTDKLDALKGAKPPDEKKIGDAAKEVETQTAKVDDLKGKIVELKARIAGLKAERANLEARIKDLEKKATWLMKEHASLENRMKNATGDEKFAFNGCGWPGGFSGGVVAIYLTSPAQYYVLDMLVAAGRLVRHSIAFTVWHNRRTMEHPMARLPGLYILMSENTFAGMEIQPSPCDYIRQAESSGAISWGDGSPNLKAKPAFPPSPTPTATATVTTTPTPTETTAPTPTATPIVSPSSTATPVPSPTPTAIATVTASLTLTPTLTPTAPPLQELTGISSAWTLDPVTGELRFTVEIAIGTLDGQIFDLEIPDGFVDPRALGEAPPGWQWDQAAASGGHLRLVTDSSPLRAGKSYFFSVFLQGQINLPLQFPLLASDSSGSLLGGFFSDIQTEVAATITTDHGTYQVGDVITTCFTVSQPGVVTITETFPDGSKKVLVDENDDGRGKCFTGQAGAPPGKRELVLTLQTYSGQTATVSTTFMVEGNPPGGWR